MFEGFEEFVLKNISKSEVKFRTLDFLASYFIDFKKISQDKAFLEAEKQLNLFLNFLEQSSANAEKTKTISLFNEISNKELIYFNYDFLNIKSIEQSLLKISDRDFEILGSKIIQKYFGSNNFNITQKSNDGGYDFSGTISLKNEQNKIDSFLSDYPIEIFGQAKKYSNKVHRPDLDNFIGFAYKKQSEKHFKPSIFLFITTSTYSLNTFKDGEKYGIFLKDGFQISQLIFESTNKDINTSEMVSNFLQ